VWIQQLHSVVPEPLVRRPAQVGGSTLFCRSIRPHELSIRLQKNPFTVTRSAHLGMGCRHIKDGHPTFEKRRAKGYMLIPGNWPVINAEIRRLLFAINNWMRAVDGNCPKKIDLRLGKNLSVMEGWPGRITFLQHVPLQRWRLSVSRKPRGCLFSGRRPKVIETQTVSGDAGKQLGIRWRTVNPPVLLRGVVIGIDRRPLRTPQRIHSRNAVEAQFTNVAAALQNGNLPPISTYAIASAAVQNIAQALYRFCTAATGHDRLSPGLRASTPSGMALLVAERNAKLPLGWKKIRPIGRINLVRIRAIVNLICLYRIDSSGQATP